jgi:hypothetical protein
MEFSEDTNAKEDAGLSAGTKRSATMMERSESPGLLLEVDDELSSGEQDEATSTYPITQLRHATSRQYDSETFK